MTNIETDGLTKRFGPVLAVDDLSFRLAVTATTAGEELAAPLGSVRGDRYTVRRDVS